MCRLLRLAAAAMLSLLFYLAAKIGERLLRVYPPTLKVSPVYEMKHTPEQNEAPQRQTHPDSTQNSIALGGVWLLNTGLLEEELTYESSSS